MSAYTLDDTTQELEGHGLDTGYLPGVPDLLQDFVTTLYNVNEFETYHDMLDHNDLNSISWFEHYAEQDPYSMHLSPSLTGFHLPLPNSLVLSCKEHEALRHYQTTYSLYRTTKDPAWSTHKVLLHMGSDDEMIMHLLLAVSLNDYSICTSDEPLARQAEIHYQSGAHMLIATSNMADKDVSMMAAYFFIYLYMSKRRSTAPQRLDKLSSTILRFVQEHNLVAYCTDAASDPEPCLQTDESAYHDRSLLARLLMWALDEDVKSDFQGRGGHFARYLARQPTSTKQIYNASRNALGDYWGSKYPHLQILDDDQNATVLEFLWVLMSLWQDINDLNGGSKAMRHNSAIEQKFRSLRIVCLNGLYSV